MHGAYNVKIASSKSTGYSKYQWPSYACNHPLLTQVSMLKLRHRLLICTYLCMLPWLTCAWRYCVNIISRTLFDTVFVFVMPLSQLNFEIMYRRYSATYQGWPASTAWNPEFRRKLWQDKTNQNILPLFDFFCLSNYNRVVSVTSTSDTCQRRCGNPYYIPI